MRIGGLGISEAAKWGETPKIQRAANKTAQNAMTDGFVGQIKEMAKKDAQKGVYMSDEFGQMRLAQMRKYVSPNRSKPVAQAAAYIQKASNRYGTLLARLLGGYSMKAYVGGLHPTAEVYAPNGEMIAAYTTAGTWKEIPTAAEEKFMSEAASVYLEAFRAARAEMKSGSQATAGGSEAGIDLRA